MSRTETPRVLVVDDEPPICRSVEKILAKVDVRTRSALNGYAALTLMETESFDVVITDLKMSSMGGLEVLRRLQEGNPGRRGGRDDRLCQRRLGRGGHEIRGLRLPSQALHA